MIRRCGTVGAFWVNLFRIILHFSSFALAFGAIKAVHIIVPTFEIINLKMLRWRATVRPLHRISRRHCMVYTSITHNHDHDPRRNTHNLFDYITRHYVAVVYSYGILGPPIRSHIIDIIKAI